MRSVSLVPRMSQVRSARSAYTLSSPQKKKRESARIKVNWRLLLLPLAVVALPVPENMKSSEKTKNIMLVIDGKTLKEQKDEVVAKVKGKVDTVAAPVKAVISYLTPHTEARLAVPNNNLRPEELGNYQVPQTETEEDSQDVAQEFIPAKSGAVKGTKPAVLRSGIHQYGVQSSTH